MKKSNSWAVTVSITVLTSFFLAVQDPSYRPAFVQVAMLTMLAPNKIEGLDDPDADDSDPDHSKEKEYEASKPNLTDPDCDKEEEYEASKSENDRDG